MATAGLRARARHALRVADEAWGVIGLPVDGGGYVVKTITVQPMSCQFSNENRAMRLRPHQHYAQVTLTFRTLGELGFPVFADTVAALHAVLTGLTERPFRDSTNEDVADSLYASFKDLLKGTDPPHDVVARPWDTAREVLTGWGGEYRLQALELAVRGVPDDIGHSDGFARYTVTG